MSYLQINGVSKSFGNKTVLSDCSLEVNIPEIYGLLGPSGAGKTTLVKMAAGLTLPTSGEIRVLDTVMPDFSTMNKIGFMAQNDALYGELTGEENIAFFSALYKMKRRTIRERTQEVLELVDLAAAASEPVRLYSGGMKRRLSLAIALMHQPDLLILDEPTVGIDPILRIKIWEKLNEIRRDGTAILLTTHVMDEAVKCGRLAMMRDGRIIASGSPAELMQAAGANTIEKAFLSYGGAGHAD